MGFVVFGGFVVVLIFMFFVSGVWVFFGGLMIVFVLVFGVVIVVLVVYV